MKQLFLKKIIHGNTEKTIIASRKLIVGVEVSRVDSDIYPVAKLINSDKSEFEVGVQFLQSEHTKLIADSRSYSNFKELQDTGWYTMYKDVSHLKHYFLDSGEEWEDEDVFLKAFELIEREHNLP